MAQKQEKKKKEDKKKNVQFIVTNISGLVTNIELREEGHYIRFRIVAIENSGKALDGLHIDIEAQQDMAHLATVATNSQGIFEGYVFAISKPGDKITLWTRCEIDQKPILQAHEIQLPKSPNQQVAKIRLRNSRPWFEIRKDKHGERQLMIVVMFYAMATGEGGVVQGASVEFLDDHPDTIYEKTLTDSEGRAIYEYCRSAESVYGVLKTVIVRVRGTEHEDEKVVDLSPAFSSLPPGEKHKTWRVVKNYFNFNFARQKLEILRHVLRTIAISVPARLSWLTGSN